MALSIFQCAYNGNNSHKLSPESKKSRIELTGPTADAHGYGEFVCVDGEIIGVSRSNHISLKTTVFPRF
jgi:hypothetical protein